MRASAGACRPSSRATDVFCSRAASAVRAAPLVPAFVVWLAACHEPRAQPHPPPPLSEAALPRLSCSPLPDRTGECARRADCGSGQLCTLDEGAALPDRGPILLRCGAPLGTAEARARCAQGAECESGLCGLAGACLEPCAQDGDCPRGQSCQPVEVRLGDDALAPLAACARVAAFPADVQVAVEADLALRAGVVNRATVAPLLESNLVFLKADCGRSLRVTRMVEREGQRMIFELDALLADVVQINPSINEGTLLPVALPNNPRVRLGAQGVDLGISTDGDTKLQLIRASRTGRGSVLDVNVFYLGGGTELDPSGLHPGSPDFAEVLARLGERYRVIGIELGEVREYDVTGALREELSELTVEARVGSSGMLEQQVAKLDRVFELSAGLDDGGVNLFVLAKLGPLLGVAGGTPGAAGLHGSPLSGVALALDTAGLARADQVLFHELGHQLGLFHTSELDGFEIEPLSDTPACGADYDEDGDGRLRGAECAERGADNVMFWEGGGTELSAQQRDVLTRALILR